jgi:hypothetical protein
MTTLLTREQVDTLRSIGDGALVMMALWMIDMNYPGRASKASEIAMYVRKDVRTVEKQLNELCASNRAANTSAGYILLEGGRALVLGMAPKIEVLALSPENSQALVTEAQAHDISAISAGSNYAHNVRALKLKGGGGSSSFSFKEEKILTPPPQESAQNAQTQPIYSVTVLDILAATEILFGDGHPVFRKGLCLELLEKDVKSVLAVMAHCWQNRARNENPSGLHNPAGKAYMMLRDFLEDGNKPRREYQLDPWAYLPDEFSERFGMVSYPCDICQATFTRKADHATHMKQEHPVTISCETCGKRFLKTADLDAHIEAEHPLPPAAPELEPLHEIDDEEIRHAWRTVQGLLSVEMPPASFDTWVRDTVAVRYDGHTLTVGTRNSYARDWLKSRMTGTIERLLSSTAGLGKITRVTFAVAVMDGDSE